MNAIPQHRNFTPYFIILLMSMIVAACTNSKLVLRPIYNSLDNRMEDRFLEYADFEKEQSNDIKTLIDHFHVWHRQTQLPAYALFLDEVAQKLDNPKTITAQDVTRWSETIQESRAKIGSCSPFYSSANILSGLSDQQLETIQKHRADQLSKRRADDGEQDNDPDDDIIADSASGRVKQVNRYLRFIGVRLNKSQRADLSATMQSTAGRTEGVRALIDQLDKELFALLQQRNEANWEAKLVDYVDKRREKMTTIFTPRRERNRLLWEAYALRTFHSLDAEQSTRTKSYLAGLARTVRALAADKPSNTELDANQYQCIGQSFS